MLCEGSMLCVGTAGCCVKEVYAVCGEEIYAVYSKYMLCVARK